MMTENTLASAEAYYKAMANKDLSGMAECLHPHVRFLGPLADITGKDAVLEGAKGVLSFFQNLTIRAKFSSETQAMIAYDLDCSLPIGLLRVASLLTFEDNLISRIELFFDARPFEKR